MLNNNKQLNKISNMSLGGGKKQ